MGLYPVLSSQVSGKYKSLKHGMMHDIYVIVLKYQNSDPQVKDEIHT